MRKNWIWGLSLLLIAGMASCKSSQSAYKAAYEKAQEKKIEEPVSAPAPVVEQPVETTTSTVEPAAPVREQSEHLNVVDSDGASLKEFNVIVGSFRQRLNAQSLCERLRKDGYPAILAQNAEGWYRVVACSFDNRPAAVQARNALQAKYPQFADGWFLINK